MVEEKWLSILNHARHIALLCTKKSRAKKREIHRARREKDLASQDNLERVVQLEYSTSSSDTDSEDGSDFEEAIEEFT